MTRSRDSGARPCDPASARQHEARVNINADIGEGAGEDEAILACVDSANIACGVHAGSASITIATAWRCRTLGVQVGAHPGYDDRSGFGRIERSMSASEIEALIAFQVASLAAVAPIAYIKPHGALYHRCQRDPEAADALARVAKAHGVGVLGQPGFEIVAAAERAGIPGYREGFADRLMLPDGSLAPRSQAGAVLDPNLATQQAVSLARSGGYDTICVHGDTRGAGQVAAAVRNALREAGIETMPLRP
ncbi:MAG: LamB/YcsF family protein [Chloroflexi bacterium]|nr:MAG: LamB/YcsF family protein [Chloroflexota bacterium]